MKRIVFFLFLALMSGLLMGQDEVKKKDKKKKEKPEKVQKVNLAETEQIRPVNPWIFEGGLDEKPGRVVAALNKNLWLAYDTATCSILRVWRGSAFVNSNTPNKDMIIEGLFFLENTGAKEVWTVKKAKKTLKPEVQFEGYEVKDNQLTLTYLFTLEGGQSFKVQEHPEYGLQKKPNSNRITLIRTFKVLDAPSDISVTMDFEVEGLAKMGDIKTSSKFAELNKSKRMYDWGDLFNVTGSLLLNNSKASTFTTTFTMDGEAYYNARPTSN